MTTSRFRHASIAAAGLDLLHMTRLKVACSLLMAERISVELHAWSGDAAPRVLVAGMDDPQGAVAAGQAARMGVGVLRIARQPGDGGGLTHGATVKVMFDSLLAMLDDEPVQESSAPASPAVAEAGASIFGDAVPAPPTLLDLVADTVGGVAVLTRPPLRIAIDRRRGVLHLARGDDEDALRLACVRPDWRMQVMTDAEFGGMRGALPISRSLEAFVWRAAAVTDADVGDAPRATALMLKAWPIIDADTLPATWLLPLACLLQDAWTRPALAQACGLPVVEVARLFAAVHHSGLGQTVDRTRPRAPRVPVAGLPPRGLVARLARRFGMQLGGHRG